MNWRFHVLWIVGHGASHPKIGGQIHGTKPPSRIDSEGLYSLSGQTILTRIEESASHQPALWSCCAAPGKIRAWNHAEWAQMRNGSGFVDHVEHNNSIWFTWSNLGNSRFTERTSTDVKSSHRLPRVLIIFRNTCPSLSIPYISYMFSIGSMGSAKGRWTRPQGSWRETRPRDDDHWALKRSLAYHLRSSVTKAWGQKGFKNI